MPSYIMGLKGGLKVSNRYDRPSGVFDFQVHKFTNVQLTSENFAIENTFIADPFAKAG